MSKQDDGFKFVLKLKVGLEKKFTKQLEDIFSTLLVKDDRVVTELETVDGNLFIVIKAKDTNILRSVINNYINAIKTLEDIDKYE